ncbi:MAG: biotin--[acetyl-CoA-carboxylase] ligase [Lachnospiraceae bacterium]|nr:biotin--[acetyl-CoA-carboxylase] ligase [Lachnospiraceae bacterium]
MKAEILTLLRNSREYVSGQDLCARFGVSRTAVWKAINQLKEEGYEIEALQNKGYILRSYPDILSKNEIASRLGTKWVGKTLYYYEDTDSTNADAMRLGEEGAEHGTLVVANHQNKGRGRRGRVWQSPVGTTISMSFLVKPEIAPGKASMLTLVMALAVAKGIEEACDLSTAIKWPNDILVNGKKVCGILTEMKAEMDYIHGVIIGVGINVNVESFPEELQSMATSLILEKGRKVSRAEVIERVAENFEEYYEKFMETEDLSLLRDLYEERLISKGKAVKVLDPQGEYTGISKGITDTGELVVETQDGKEQQVYAGEVSVRGIYGYV